MPLRSDILDPIPGPAPGGENLRYAPIYDKIKEARREEEDVPQGDWARERKVADWPLTIKLIGEALAAKTKDLQLAAWLTEALLRREGIAGLKEGLDLIRAMLEQYWDTLWPEIEDGDAEFRATPLQWVGDRLEQPVKRSPLARNGLDWYQYKESRTIGYEEDATTDEKQQARQAAIDDHKITGELWDAAFNGTPKAFYASLLETYDATLGSIEALGQICDEKFGDVSPGFGRLRSVLEEVRQSVYILLQKKREKEPDEAQPGVEERATEEEEGVPEPQAEAPPTIAPSAAAVAPARARVSRPLAGQPADREDAISRVAAAAKFIRGEDAYSPAPYLMLRGLRWGELRANGESPDPAMLAAPPTEVRQQLKQLAADGQWTEVLEAAETAMGEPWGRAWIDLQRYVCRACSELGSYYDPIANAIRSDLRALLADIPTLTDLTLADDTPTANGETMAWIREQVAAPASQGGTAVNQMSSSWEEDTAAPAEGEEKPPDAFELAMQAVQNRDPEEGIAILFRELKQERCGRARFQRKIQLAQLCLAAGHQDVAEPILADLAAEIERRHLEDWEAAEIVAHPLTLLYRCWASNEALPQEEKHRLYARICCLDPVQALTCSK